MRRHLTNAGYPDSQAMPEPWAQGYGLDKNNTWEDVSNTVPVSLMGAAGEMYNTANYYNPATGMTIVAWVTLQRATPGPGVANAIFRDIAHVMQPGKEVPFSTKGQTL